MANKNHQFPFSWQKGSIPRATKEFERHSYWKRAYFIWIWTADILISNITSATSFHSPEIVQIALCVLSLSWCVATKHQHMEIRPLVGKYESFIFFFAQTMLYSFSKEQQHPLWFFLHSFKLASQSIDCLCSSADLKTWISSYHMFVFLYSLLLSSWPLVPTSPPEDTSMFKYGNENAQSFW